MDYLPSPDPEEDDDLSGKFLIGIIDSEEVADLLDNADQHQSYQMEVDKKG